jgi:hypothetical protein
MRRSLEQRPGLYGNGSASPCDTTPLNLPGASAGSESFRGGKTMRQGAALNTHRLSALSTKLATLSLDVRAFGM